MGRYTREEPTVMNKKDLAINNHAPTKELTIKYTWDLLLSHLSYGYMQLHEYLLVTYSIIT